MLGIIRPKRPQPFDADLYRAAVARLKQIMLESAEPDARADALALLTDMGVVKTWGGARPLHVGVVGR